MYNMYRAKVDRLAGKTDFLQKKGLKIACLGRTLFSLHSHLLDHNDKHIIELDQIKQCTVCEKSAYK